MSRYILLVIFNLPIITLACIGIITRYKMNKITPRRARGQIIMWLILIAAIALSGPIYQYLFDNNFTDTNPLSLFDVVQITLIVFLLYVVNGLSIKNDITEQRLHELHKQLSIKLSKDSNE